MIDAWIVFGVLGAVLVLFIGGWWRFDVVALLALLVLAALNIVPRAEAFLGFGHPAVITVAAVLVVSRGLVNAGVINPVARLMGAVNHRPTLQIAALTIVVAACSGFMNNIGALALLMPVAISMARKSGRSPSLLLMPLAFGSLLGGLITLIGTPPNIIIATFRQEATGTAFRMFDFAPVGLVVAAAGVLFLVLLGWRFLPERQPAASPDALFDITDYLAELRVPQDSSWIGRSIADLGEAAESEAIVVGLHRNKRKIAAPSRYEPLRSGDVLTVEVDPEALKDLLDQTDLELVGSEEGFDHAISTDEVKVVEAVIAPNAMIIGRTAEQLHLRWRHGLNLLAVARQGQRLKSPLRKVRFQPGDVLLLQGDAKTIHEALSVLGCLPLADRELQIGLPKRLVPALGIFLAAILAAATDILPVQIAFAAAAMLMVMTGLVSLRGAYEAIDWPVIVLLGAMIPVGAALESTGGASMIAELMLRAEPSLPGWAIVLALLVLTMFLSDIVNNAAAAVLIAPIAISLAQSLDASVDPFLMAVAIGASCAFLTPIGHQSNTLVMGPGGYRFGDYWRMGLPLEIVIALVAVPMILLVWPL